MAQQRSKRYRASAEKRDDKKVYPLAEAIAALKAMPPTKFDQTVTLAFRLGVDPKQSDQMVRGTCPLPHGSGKTVKVAVFAQGNAAEAAKAAGVFWKQEAEMLRQARSWRLEDIDRVLDSVNAADIATKTTGSPDQLIAERLLLEIAARARRLGL